MAIAQFPSIVIDCPDAGALANLLYGAMLDWKVDVSSDWADIRSDESMHLVPAGGSLHPASMAGPGGAPSRSTST